MCGSETVCRIQSGPYWHEAVEFGLWVRDREIPTMALGESMTTAPATTQVHYRIEESPKRSCSRSCRCWSSKGASGSMTGSRTGCPRLLAADQTTVRVGNTA